MPTRLPLVAPAALVAVLGAGLGLAGCASGTPSGAVVSGHVIVVGGPMSSTATAAPSRPAHAQIEAFVSDADDASAIATSGETDADGAYTLQLDPGSYYLAAVGGDGVRETATVHVTVTAGEHVTQDFPIAVP